MLTIYHLIIHHASQSDCSKGHCIPPFSLPRPPRIRYLPSAVLDVTHSFNIIGRDLAPNFKALVNNFKNRTVIFGNGDDLIAPYFEGYCGTHTSQYPGQHLKQLAGPLLYHSPSMVTGTARKAAGSYSTGKGKRRASVSFGMS